MAEVVQALVILALIVGWGWDHARNAEERRTLLNRLVATTPAELIALEREPAKPVRKLRAVEDEDRPVEQVGI